MAKRSYLSGDTAGLIALSRGSCYWPECGQPVVRLVSDRPMMNLEIAHIRAATRNGPRYVEEMSDEERRAFANLILLCHPHHNAVDQNEEEFPIKLLEEWKSKRETSGQAALSGLREVTEERLQEMIASALESREKKVDEALDRLGQVDIEAARVLRGLIDELTDLRMKSWFPNEDTAGLLLHAGDRLRGVNEDTASALIRAGRDLRGINEDTVNSLLSVSNRLNSLHGLAEELHAAADRLRR